MAYLNSQYRPVEPARLEQRKAQRHPVLVQRSTVRKHKAPPIEALLVDLSIYGCKLEIESDFKANDRLWLRFEGGSPVAATAIWYEGGKLGCRFDDAIDRDMFRSLTLVFD